MEPFNGPDSLRRSIALQALRDAGEEGLPWGAFAVAMGEEAEKIIDDLRGRGHCIQTRRPDEGRVILHEPKRGAA